MKRLMKMNPKRTLFLINFIVMTLIFKVTPVHGSTGLGEEEDKLWMECCNTAPFESDLAEADLTLESWMTAPFESDLAEADLTLESWMTAPFESDLVEPDLTLESWMISAF
jgi:hypothetical protein